MMERPSNHQDAGTGRCADRHEARVATRDRAVGMADRSSGKSLLRLRGARRSGRPENDAHNLARVSEPAGEKAGQADEHPRSPSSPLHARFMSTPYGPFNGLIWPKTGCASTGLAQQRRHNFLPLG